MTCSRRGLSRAVLSFLTRTKRRKMTFFEGCPVVAWWTGGYTKRRKMTFFEGCPVGLGGGTHRSWPGGRGGRPRALVAGEGWVGRRGWMAVPKKGSWGLVGCSKEGHPGKGWLAWQFHRRGQGFEGESKGFGSGSVGVVGFDLARGGPRASVPGEVGGRGTGPRDGANFANVCHIG